MQVPGSGNAGPGSDILGLKLMSEGIETLMVKPAITVYKFVLLAF